MKYSIDEERKILTLLDFNSNVNDTQIITNKLKLIYNDIGQWTIKSNELESSEDKESPSSVLSDTKPPEKPDFSIENLDPTGKDFDLEVE